MKDLAMVAKKARKHVLQMAYEAKDSHIGCSLSAIEILVALYFEVMNIDPDYPTDRLRDRFILSKGHAAAALYAVLAERGFFPVEALSDFAREGSRIADHIERHMPGVETNGGSGGHGLSLGVGMALAAAADNLPSRVFVLMGDGELQEGSVWEAAMFAASRNLKNLTLIVDVNGFQTWTQVRHVVEVEPLEDKFKAFGWATSRINGHHFHQLTDYLRLPSSRPPHVIFACTRKGKGVSFMEDHGEDWHNGVMTPEQYVLATREVEDA